ncbi:MAG: NAD-binding protein [Thiobacillus sp.]|nr:NAD-binding protein [Thiobacillus sp.]
MFERRHPFRELAVEHAHRDGVRPDVIVFGLGRYGSRLAHALKQQDIQVLGVDFDPEVVRAQQNHGMNAHFGDGEASDFVESLPLKDVPWVVSTLPDHDSNQALLHALTLNRFNGHIAIVARDETEAERLAHLDQVEVLHPFNQAADFAALDLAARIASAELSAAKEST